MTDILSMMMNDRMDDKITEEQLDFGLKNLGNNYEELNLTFEDE